MTLPINRCDMLTRQSWCMSSSCPHKYRWAHPLYCTGYELTWVDLIFELTWVDYEFTWIHYEYDLQTGHDACHHHVHKNTGEPILYKIDLNWLSIWPCPSTDVICWPDSHDACHHHVHINTGEPILSIVLTMNWLGWTWPLNSHEWTMNSLEFIMNITSRLVMIHVIIMSKWIQVSPCSLKLTWLRIDLNCLWIQACPSTVVICLPGSHDACHYHEYKWVDPLYCIGYELTWIHYEYDLQADHGACHHHVHLNTGEPILSIVLTMNWHEGTMNSLELIMNMTSRLVMMHAIIMSTQIEVGILCIVLTMNWLEFIMNTTSRLVMMHAIIMSTQIEVSPSCLKLTWIDYQHDLAHQQMWYVDQTVTMHVIIMST